MRRFPPPEWIAAPALTTELPQIWEALGTLRDALAEAEAIQAPLLVPWLAHRVQHLQARERHLLAQFEVRLGGWPPLVEVLTWPVLR